MIILIQFKNLMLVIKIMKQPVNLGALCDGVYVLPSNAVKTKKYICPDCDEGLILKKGQIKKHHFCHKSNSECTYYSPHPSESQIHKDAKLRIKQILDDKKKLEYTIKNPCKELRNMLRNPNSGIKVHSQWAGWDTTHKKIIVSPESEVVLEHRFVYDTDTIGIADVAVINKKTRELEYIIEICNTHRTASRPCNWCEFNADTVVFGLKPGFSCIRSYTCDECEQNERRLAEENLKREEEKKVWFEAHEFLKRHGVLPESSVCKNGFEGSSLCEYMCCLRCDSRRSEERAKERKRNKEAKYKELIDLLQRRKAEYDIQKQKEKEDRFNRLCKKCGYYSETSNSDEFRKVDAGWCGFCYSNNLEENHGRDSIYPLTVKSFRELGLNMSLPSDYEKLMKIRSIPDPPYYKAPSWYNRY
jgi:ribosomal protein S27AE